MLKSKMRFVNGWQQNDHYGGEIKINALFEVREKVNLKPCPFCGGKAYIIGMFIPTEDDEINAYSVGCEECEISFQQNWDYDYIVEKWNRRK